MGRVRCYRPRSMATAGPSGAPVYDLRGVPCPLNWARAKARLERLTRGEVLVILTDAPRAERDIPAAAETEGWAVLEVFRTDDAVRIVIER